MAFTTKRGKKWYAVWVDASGVKRQKAGYVGQRETQQLADRLETEARSVRMGDIDPQVEQRRIERAKVLASHITDYRTTLEAAGRSAGHVAYTIADINALADYAAAEGQPLASASAITRPLVDRWQHHQQRQQKAKVKGNSNKTINRRIGSVQAFLRHLAEHGGVTSYVLNRYPKLPTTDHHKTRQTRALTADELAKLLTCGDIPEHRRQRYTVAARSGLRMGELRQMVGRYFATADKLIHVPAHVAKAKRDQTIPMHPTIAAVVKPLAKSLGPDQPLFPMPTKQHVINQLRADAKAAGVDPAGLGFHSLRHTFATMLARANVHPALLQRLARHADLKTTLRYYVHLQRTDEMEAINQL